MQVFETNWNGLYQSAVEAFPQTTMRQYATDPIKINSLSIVPFLGVKTLFLKCDALNEDRHYNTMLLFRNVEYKDQLMKGFSEVTGIDGISYFLRRPSLSGNDVLLRCQCDDFKYRFKYYDHLDKSLYGSKGKKYEGRGLWKANPMELPGACKHLMKMIEVLKSDGYLVD